MGFFDGPRAGEIENWVWVMERGTEYGIAMDRDYLSHLKVPSNILSKRDSAYNLNIGEMSMVYLYVPKEFESRARKALRELDEGDPDQDDRNGHDGDGGEQS